MFKPLLSLFLVVSLVLPLASCSGDPNAGIMGMGQKESVGTGMGAAAGAILGGVFGGKYKVIAALGGAALGGLLGNRIGSMLDDDDRAALLRRQQQVLSQEPDQTPADWASTHSRARATIVASNTHAETKQVRILRNATVADPGPIVAIGARYQAVRRTIVRASPAADGAQVETLGARQRIWVVGAPQGSDWLLVSRGGQSIGYVRTAMLTRIPKTSAARPVATASVSAPGAGPVDSPINLDDVEPVDAAAQAKAVPTTVTASLTCRSLQTTATSGSQSQSSKADACMTPQGVWELN